MKIQEQKPYLWSEQRGHELYVFWRGQIILKRWTKNGKKTQPSVLFNKNWPHVEII